MGAVVFLDTETTKRERGYRPWDIALIRREISGEESAITIFVEQDDLDLANADPEALEIGGFSCRHPQNGAHLEPGQVLCAGADASGAVSADDVRVTSSAPTRLALYARGAAARALGRGRSTATQMIDSTHIKTHRSAAGAKGGSRHRRSVALVEGATRRSMHSQMLKAAFFPSS